MPEKGPEHRVSVSKFITAQQTAVGKGTTAICRELILLGKVKLWVNRDQIAGCGLSRE
jgi:hypothetical protein